MQYLLGLFYCYHIYMLAAFYKNSVCEVTCMYKCHFPCKQTYSTRLLALSREYHSQPSIASKLLFLSANCQNHPTVTKSLCLPEPLISFFSLFLSLQNCPSSPPACAIFRPSWWTASCSINRSNYQYMIEHHLSMLESLGHLDYTWSLFVKYILWTQYRYCR